MDPTSVTTETRTHANLLMEKALRTQTGLWVSKMALDAKLLVK